MTCSLTVILTRFSRVTFNAAHKYLGLTSEVLRTEKAINDIACHPLPPSFYEGGGLQYLRHRFDGASSSNSESDSDYFGFSPSPSQNPIVLPKTIPISSSTASLGKISDNPIPLKSSFYRGLPRAGSTKTSRHMVQAGDLLIPQGSVSDFSRTTRGYGVLNTPQLAQSSFNDIDHGKKMKATPRRWSSDDFDLREAVMSCIAKSIGLLQPPLSHGDSDSPKSPPSEYRNKSSTHTFSSPFGSLSLLDIGDDVSSTAASTSSFSTNNLSGLDNEVEILFYAAGTTLAKAGEVNTGKCDILSYVCVALMKENRLILRY
jgi:lysophospholipid hydrolase